MTAPVRSHQPLDYVIPVAAAIGVVVGEEEVRHRAGRILWQARIDWELLPQPDGF